MQGDTFFEIARMINLLDANPKFSFRDDLIRIAVETAVDCGILRDSEVKGKNLQEQYKALKAKIKE